MEAFAAEGLSVPVAEIVRRAGVGTGTASRHFPMKDFLCEAIVLHLVGGIVDKARDLSAKNDPGSAFFQFLAHRVERAAVNRGLAEAISPVTRAHLDPVILFARPVSLGSGRHRGGREGVDRHGIGQFLGLLVAFTC